MTQQERATRSTLAQFLSEGHAHAAVKEAVANFPAELYSTKPAGVPHSAWELLEHMRLTLRDLLEFCRNPVYRARKWPEEYWPRTGSPRSQQEWENSARDLLADIKAFQKLVLDESVDLNAKIEWGEGQTILREALLAIDHTSYHTGQLIMLRKQLGAWKD